MAYTFDGKMIPLDEDEIELLAEALEELRSDTETFGIKHADDDEEINGNKARVAKIELLINKLRS